jgi:hypothetical protein
MADISKKRGREREGGNGDNPRGRIRKEDKEKERGEEGKGERRRGKRREEKRERKTWERKVRGMERGRERKT